MDKIVERKLCTGCTACANICPKKAIKMGIDEEGFKYPVIDQNKCVNCGLCQKTCPVLGKSNNTSINDCYVSYAKDEKLRKNASSGGVFPLIANYVLKNNGIVIGAAFDNNKLKHIAIKEKKFLNQLQGSKYLQSDLDNIFKYIKENVNDKKILFVGVPCQVAGLKAFLKREYENLICIDLVCHGVPSPKLFEKYCEELEKLNNDKLINYNFRDKSTGWDTYSVKATFKNSSFIELSRNNNYSKLFLSDIALRESCYQCNFKIGNKYSDITLGDFWGVQNYYPDMYNKSGVSAVILNTNKGLEIYNSIKEDMVYQKCQLEEIIAGNASLKKSCIRPKNREDFFEKINYNSISDLTSKYSSKVGILKLVILKVKSLLKGGK